MLGFADAQHAEYDPYASNLFITEPACSLAGQTMSVALAADSGAARYYDGTEASELFVPQTSSAPGAPHPLIVAYLRAVLTPPP